MSNWLQKITRKQPAHLAKRNVSTHVKRGVPSVQVAWRKLELTKGLPNASIVYGAAAGAFFVFAIYLLFRKHWLDGLLTLLPAACFLGFAMHILKYGQPKR
jgi:hypothetical protein